MGSGHFFFRIIESWRKQRDRCTESVHAMDWRKILTLDMRRALLIGDLREFDGDQEMTVIGHRICEPLEQVLC